MSDDENVVRFTLRFPVPEGSDPSDPYSMIGNITLHPFTCLACGQGIAEAGVCSDCERELGGNYRIAGRTVYIPADDVPDEPMDPLGATLDEDEQRERFASYGRGGEE